MRLIPFARALLLGLAVLCAALSAARADAVDDALRRFAADSFDDTQKGIEELAQTGHATAEDVLAALLANRLFIRSSDKAAVYRDAAGALRDAKTGDAVEADAKALKPVRLNNRLRRVVEGALGSLTLLAADPQKRIRAAEAVFKSRDAAALPVIDTALSRESSGAARRALEAARAAIVLARSESPETDRLAAVATLASRGNGEAAALLRSLPAGTPETVRTAASSAVTTIENRLALWAIAAERRLRHQPRLGAAARGRRASPSPSARWASSTWRMARW